MYAMVLCELNGDNVTCIPGKSRIFYVQRDFQKFEYEYFKFCQI